MSVCLWFCLVLLLGSHVVVAMTQQRLRSFQPAQAWSLPESCVESSVYISSTNSSIGFVGVSSPSGNHFVNAIELTTGSTLWTFEAASILYNNPVEGFGIVFVVDYLGHLYALNSTNGNLVWTVTLTSQYVGATPLISTTMANTPAVFLGDVQWKAFHALNGTLLWSYSPLGVASANGVLDSNNNNIIFGGSLGHVYSISAMNGNMNWLTNVGSSTSPPTAFSITDFSVFVGTYAGPAYSLSISSGQVFFELPFQVASPPAFSESNQVLFWPGVNGVVYATGTDGKIVWNQNVSVMSSYGLNTIPVVKRGVVYVGHYGGLTALNEASGEVLWTFTTNSTVAWHSAPAIQTSLAIFGACNLHSGESGATGVFAVSLPSNNSVTEMLCGNPSCDEQCETIQVSLGCATTRISSSVSRSITSDGYLQVSMFPASATCNPLTPEETRLYAMGTCYILPTGGYFQWSGR